MVWQYRSPILVGRRGIISSFKWFLPAVAMRLEEGGGDVGTLWYACNAPSRPWPDINCKAKQWGRVGSLWEEWGNFHVQMIFTCLRYASRGRGGMSVPCGMHAMHQVDHDPTSTAKLSNGEDHLVFFLCVRFSINYPVKKTHYYK